MTETEGEAAGDHHERSAPVGGESYRESSVLAQVYERCREAFMVAHVALTQLQQTPAKWGSGGREWEEVRLRVGDFQQWAQLALRMANAEVEAFARERAALKPKLALRLPPE